MHLHICRPRSLVEREIRSTYTCIIDSLPVLGLVQTNNVGWAILEQVSRKIRERPAKDQGACCKVPRWQGRLPALDTTCCTQVNCDYRVCKHNCSSHNGSRAHAANKRAWRWSRERFAKETFFLAKMAFSGNRNIDQLPHTI